MEVINPLSLLFNSHGTQEFGPAPAPTLPRSHAKRVDSTTVQGACFKRGIGMRFPRHQTFRLACLCLAFFYPLHLRSLNNPHSSPGANDSNRADGESIVIPGPLRSFLRMAGISQEVTPDQVLPMLARNVSLYGYSGGNQKEYLVLLDRYVHLARDVQRLSDSQGMLRISGCKDAGELLNALGYRLEKGCGQRDTSLMTANADRAFLTIDSGFPLSELERSLQKDTSFEYDFSGTRVPVLLPEKNWVSTSKWRRNGADTLLDVLLHDQDLDRLYSAFARYDSETRTALNRAPGLNRLAPLAAVIDLYGGQICIKEGRVIVPGNIDKPWEELAGESPRSPGQFVVGLLSKDGGWLASYFDALSRLNQSQQAHFTEGSRLKRFYSVYRSTAARSDASKGVYPRNGDLLILLSSLKWQPDGDVAIPGDVATWDAIFAQMAKSREVRPWLGRSHEWNTSGRLLETLIGSSNYRSENGPIQVFLMLSAIDAARPADRQLSADTAKLVAHRYPHFSRWFRTFAEFPALTDNAIAQFVVAADKIGSISNTTLRANALGSFQADVGLWQILAHQHQIPENQLDSSWLSVVQPFIGVTSTPQLFEAARSALQGTLKAASGDANLNQDQIVELLAGPVRQDRDGQRVHRDIANRIRAVLEDQRLASLDSLFGLYDGLTQMAHGAAAGSSLLPLAESLREFEMPRPIFSGNERSSWAPIIYTSRHAELQVRTDLTRILKSPASPSQVETARGQLTPFFRDTLVGLNYAYYEPPGAEVLHNNPLFVRSHDFSSVSVQGVTEIWDVPRLVGVGVTAGGGAYLLGSLADLPYALAMTEEDFIVPKNVQALIWREVVPNLLVGATLPRWWDVNPNELHIAALYQRAGEELVSSSVHDPDLRVKVIELLSDRITPVRLEQVSAALQSDGDAKRVVSSVPPADLFYLAFAFRNKYPDLAEKSGTAGRELNSLCSKAPSDSTWERLSADFGVPHPSFMVTNSSSLLNLKAASSYGGNAGRIFAESWDSNNLYWARIADEMGYQPVELNLLAPELTRNMITNIFASNTDDWPALQRAMLQTGEEFRKGKIVPDATIAKSAE